MIEIKDPQYWETLKQKIYEHTKFNTQDYSDKFISRRIEVRLRSLNIDSYLTYAKILETDAKEHDKLLKEFGIHVTHFFRDIEFWNVFQEKIIPEIIAWKKSQDSKQIRIWSAGCSTGEEAYSIIMCFMSKLGNDFLRYDIKLIGTDFDSPTVLAAKHGIYDEFQFKEMQKENKDKYFVKNGNQYAIRDELKKYVEFQAGNILKDAKPTGIDILFCRNTVIYFETEAKSKLYVDFFNSINPKGFFIMGKTETLNGPARDLFEMFDLRERVYRKP